MPGHAGLQHNNCPVGIATQRENLRMRFKVESSAAQLDTYLRATVKLMSVIARACGYARMSDFNADDLTAWKRDIADLTGVRFAGA